MGVDTIDDVSDTFPPVRLRPEIAALPAYKQGKPAAAGGYKLSSNENPFAPLPGVLAAVTSAEEINRYPDAAATELRAALAARYGVEIEEVHIGAGSVSLITQFITAAAGVGDEVVYPWRSFEAYPGQVTVAGATSVQVPLLPDGSHDLERMAARVTEQTRVIIVCTPNNPTGTVVRRDSFERFMQVIPADRLVLLDEAYAEFVRDPDAVDGAELLGKYPNLVVLRTFSKAWGLAGLRLGYAIGAAHLLDAARATALPLSVTAAAQAAGIAALAHEQQLSERVQHIVARRDAVLAGLRELGILVPEAHGNFVWLASGERTTEVAEILDRNSIMARVFPGEGIRVSIGEQESVDVLLRSAREIVRNLPGALPVAG